MNKIQLQGKTLHYTLKVSKRATGVRLALYADGNCIVTQPAWLSFERVERFILEKADWLYSKIDFLKNENSSIENTPLQLRKNKIQSKKTYAMYKQQALSLAIDRLKFFNEIYNLPIGKITVRNQKTRWGSCSRKGNLNFNYKIALIPAYLADYVVVHELCHIGQFNHSKNFWNLVAVALPNWKELRGELKNIKL